MLIKRISSEHPAVVALLYHYHKKWGVNPETYTSPATWLGYEDEQGKILAVLGCTIAHEQRIAFVAELLCVQTRKGMRAMIYLVEEFARQAYNAGIESVCAQCVYGNETMRKFLERHVGLRPLSVVYAVTRKEYENGRRR